MLTGMVTLLTIQGHAGIANGITLAQGSYTPWSKYSANTHVGCGVVDISRFNSVTGKLWTQAEWAIIVAAARQVGFAAWHRFAIKGLWVEHAHCVAIGCPDLNVPDATDQVTSYRNGHDGLASNGPDNGPRDWVSMTWESHEMTLTPPPPAIPQEDDDMSYVMSAKTATGEAFYLVTPQGRIGIGSMDQADACLSALQARVTRTWGPSPYGWRISHPTPCLQSEADILESLEQTVRDRAKTA